MSDVTYILTRIESGDPRAAEQLLPLVYEELRKLATARLAQEEGQSLQPTVLVHEAYLRLVDGDVDPHWNGRGHFFGAAARPEIHVAFINHAEREIGTLRSLRQGTADRLRLSQRRILCANRVVTARRQPVVTTREMHQPSTC